MPFFLISILFYLEFCSTFIVTLSCAYMARKQAAYLWYLSKSNSYLYIICTKCDCFNNLFIGPCMFKSVGHLYHHMKYVHRDKRFKCNKCGKVNHNWISFCKCCDWLIRIITLYTIHDRRSKWWKLSKDMTLRYTVT